MNKWDSPGWHVVRVQTSNIHFSNSPINWYKVIPDDTDSMDQHGEIVHTTDYLKACKLAEELNQISEVMES